MSELGVLRVACVLMLGSLAACGQKGPLYLPDQARDIVTRPTQTPPPPESSDAPNSARSPDSPVEPASPAPEVTPPANGDQTDKDGKKPGTSPPR